MYPPPKKRRDLPDRSPCHDFCAPKMRCFALAVACACATAANITVADIPTMKIADGVNIPM